MSTPPTLRSLCESATPGPYFVGHVACATIFAGERMPNESKSVLNATGQNWPADVELHARLDPQTMLKVLDALEGILKDSPTVECNNFHHSSKDRHEGFVCPPHQRWIAALQSAREALNLLNGSTPEKI